MQMGRGAALSAIGLLLLSGALAFDRQLLQAPAPAPIAGASTAPAPAAGARQAANGVFIFDAASVIFTNATTLMLSGLPNNTAYVQYPPSVSAGTFAKDVFFSTELADSASGRWLGGPQVLLQGTLNGNISNVIVTLNAPVYNPQSQTVMATYVVFKGTNAALPVSGGVANSVLSSVAAASTGKLLRIPAITCAAAPTVLTSVPLESKMMNVTAFVDVTNIAQYTQKQAVGEKAGLIRVPLGYSWPGAYGYGYPYGK